MKLEDMERYFSRLGPDQDILRLASYNKLELIKELVEKRGANVNAKSHHSETTPLHETIIGEEEFGETSVEIMKYLISKGADVNALNSKEQTPLDLATEKSRPSCIQELLRHKAQPNTLDIIQLKTVVEQNYIGVDNVIVQIQNIDAFREVILKLEDSEEKDDLLDKLARQDTRLTQKLPQYISKKTQEGYENLKEKFQDLKYIFRVSKLLEKDTKNMESLLESEVAQDSQEELEDARERVKLMKKYSYSYLDSVNIMEKDMRSKDFINVTQKFIKIEVLIASVISEFLSFEDFYKITFDLSKQVKNDILDDLPQSIEKLTLDKNVIGAASIEEL